MYNTAIKRPECHNSALFIRRSASPLDFIFSRRGHPPEDLLYARSVPREELVKDEFRPSSRIFHRRLFTPCISHCSKADTEEWLSTPKSSSPRPRLRNRSTCRSW